MTLGKLSDRDMRHCHFLKSTCDIGTPPPRAPIDSPSLRGADRPTDRISLLSVTVTVAVTVTVRQVAPCQVLPPTGHLTGHQPLIVLTVKVNRLAPGLGPKGETGIGLSGRGYSGNLRIDKGYGRLFTCSRTF